MLQIDLTFIATILHFLLLTGILTLILYRPIKKFMADRQRSIESSLREAAEAQRKADELKAEYEAKLAEARRETMRMVEEATRQAEAIREQIIAKAREEAHHIQETAREEIARKYQETWEKIKADVIDIAIAAASKVIESEINEEKSRRIVAELIDELAGAEEGGRP